MTPELIALILYEFNECYEKSPLEKKKGKRYKVVNSTMSQRNFFGSECSSYRMRSLHD